MHTQPGTAADAPSKRRLEAGPTGRRLLGRLLGLDRPGGRFAAIQARWLAGRFEIVVQTAQGRPVELILEATRGEAQRRPFLSNGRVDLWYRGQLADGLENLLRRAVARWSEVSIEQILERFLTDPDLVELPGAPSEERSSEPSARGAEAGDVPASDPLGPERGEVRGRRGEVPLGTWDPVSSFADFLGLDTIDLMPYEAIESTNPFVRISHSDLECLSFMPPERASNLNLVDFPWIARRERLGPPSKQQETTLCTDLTEQAVIMGCNAHVRRVLDAVLALDLGKPIIFTNTCLPATTSEDVMSVLRRYRQRAPVSVVSHNRAAPDLDDDMPSALLRRHRVAAPAGPDERKPDLVNLIGFPPDETLDELERLLQGIGLRVNAAILPVVRAEDLDRFPRASLNVFHRTNRFWEHSYEQLAADHPIPSLHPPSPYGVAGTRGWLEAIAEATGRRASVKDAWEQRFAPLRAEWQRLTEEARDVTVGLVVRPRDIECLEDPGLTNGVPLLAVLGEIGFGLAVWVHTPDDGLARLSARVEALIPPAYRRRCQVLGFEDLDDLRRELRDSPARAVVSNHTFDWRLTEAGKNRISLRHFEKGLEGALRTARRLLGVCRVAFAQRYARFLARDALGRRRIPPKEG